MQLFRRTTTAIITILIASFAPSHSSAQEIPKLNLGIVVPLSGSQKPYGEEIVRGIDLAFSHLSKEDEKFAARVHISKHDDQSKSDVAGKLAEELYGEKRIHIIIGSIASASTQAIAKSAQKHRRPLITPLATSGDITGGGFIYRTCLHESLQGNLLGSFAANHLKVQRAAILRDGSSSAKSMAAGFEKSFSGAGRTVLDDMVYEFGAIEFGSQLKALKKKKVQAVLLPAYSLQAAEIMKQAKNIGLKAKFLGSDSWDTPNLKKVGGDAVSGHFFTAQFAEDKKNERLTTFMKEFKSVYGRDPGTIAALAYDSFYLAIDAVRRARSTLKTPLQRAFDRTTDLQGITGLLTLGSEGESLKSGFIKETYAGGSRFRTVIAPKGMEPQAKGH